jgi:hypothetical protein
VAAAGGTGAAIGTTLGTAPLCLTGPGCAVPILAITGGTAAAAAGIDQWFLALDDIEDAEDDVVKAREAAEDAEAVVKNAHKAAQEWKDSNCN